MDDRLFRRGLGALFIACAFACAPGGGSAPPAPEGRLVHTLTYAAGPAWKVGAPLEAQGLGPHFAFMSEKLGDGTLVANGPFGDAIEGFYVFAVEDKAGVDAIVADDPAVESGTLAPLTIAPWLLLMDALDAPRRDGESLFVLEYGPGPHWKAGKPLGEQKIGPHTKYVSELFAAGSLLAGGPIPGQDRGRYIVSVAREAGARALVDHDPGVEKGVFTVKIRPWMMAPRT